MYSLTPKAQFSLNRWRAALLIQRLWRKSSQIDSMFKAADLLMKDDDVMRIGKQLAESRAAACLLICKFLTALKGGLRSAVSGFVRCA